MLSVVFIRLYRLHIIVQNRVALVMLTISMKSGISISTILLCVINVIDTRQYDTIYQTNEYQNQIKNCYPFSLNFSCTYHEVFEQFVILSILIIPTSSEDTCDSLTINRLSEGNCDLESTVNNLLQFENAENCINYVYVVFLKTLFLITSENIVGSNVTAIEVDHSKKNLSSMINNVSLHVEKDQKIKNDSFVDYKWRKRSLCAVSGNVESTSKPFLHYPAIINEKKNKFLKRKRLQDFEESVLLNEVEDSDSFITHKRVKRSKPKSDTQSLYAHKEDDIKNLIGKVDKWYINKENPTVSNSQETRKVSDINRLISNSESLNAGIRRRKRNMQPLNNHRRKRRKKLKHVDKRRKSKKNNFRRKKDINNLTKSKKSIEKGSNVIKVENDPLPKLNVLPSNLEEKKIEIYKIDSQSPKGLDATERADQDKVQNVERVEILTGQKENPIVASNRQSRLQKLRTKRDKEPETKQSFRDDVDELKYYESIREPEPVIGECLEEDESSSLENNQPDGSRAGRSIEEVKKLAKKLVTKVNELEKYINNNDNDRHERRKKKVEVRALDNLCSNFSTASSAFKEMPKIMQRCVPLTTYEFTTAKTIVVRNVETSRRNKRKQQRAEEKRLADKKRSKHNSFNKMISNKSERDTNKQRHKWGRWTDWSSCSVTCGKGRQIRWRYCLRDCSVAETEMEEKSCQLPACRPGKFLGIF